MKTLLLLSLSFLLALPNLKAQHAFRALQLNFEGGPSLFEEGLISSRGFSPSILWYTPKGFRHQLEWKNPSFRHQDNQEAIQFRLRNAFRYELDYQLWNPLPRLGLYAGVSLSWYQGYDLNLPYLANAFKTTYFASGIQITAVPLALFSVGERCYLELAIPIEVLNTGLEQQNELNPSLPPDLQKSSSSFVEIRGWTSVRLGMGIKI